MSTNPNPMKLSPGQTRTQLEIGQQRLESVIQAIRASDHALTIDEVSQACGISAAVAYGALQRAISRNLVARIIPKKRGQRGEKFRYEAMLPAPAASSGARKSPDKVNPFAVAAGLVKAPKGWHGRIYRQSMAPMDDEEEIAA